MPRYKLTIEYDGTPFSGWQVQKNGPSVQGALRDAIRAFAREDVMPRGAGRTDAGVHALAQIAHVDLNTEWTAQIVMRALNHHLRPQPISVLSCERVDSSFDARFSATARHYLYRIVTRPGPLAIDRDRAWHIKHILDLPAMQEAAQVLIGHHDFTTFRAAQCQSKSPEKTLDLFTVEREGDEIRIRASARSFLHHQVRSMTGSIKLVGEGKWTAATTRAALEARDRAACGMVAPSCGLYLLRVDY